MLHLKELREEVGMSVETLSERTGLTRTQIWHYEAGRREPALDALCAIADALDCSLDLLVRGKEKDHSEEWSRKELLKRLQGYDLAALKRKRDRLTDLYLSDLIAREKYEEEFLAVSQAIIDAEKAPKPIDRAEVMSVLEVYRTLSRAAQRAFWSNLIKSITPTEDGFDFTLNYT